MHLEKYQDLPFHPTTEKLSEILQRRTQNEDPTFFRLVISYFLSKITSMMRIQVEIGEEQVVPVNMYAINLAPSGSGKNHSISIIEDEIISNFRDLFLEYTFPKIAEEKLAKLALKRAQKNDSDHAEELQKAILEFEELGTLLFSFDSATSAAIKQMRTKLLMGGAGSMNLEIDEIGSNLTGSREVLNDYLELFDTGRIKQKLTKNTRDNVRSEDLVGVTPTNMLLFGTPGKLLNGGKIEDEFYEMLDIGYARRCFFGISKARKLMSNQTPQEMYNLYHDPKSSKFLIQINEQLGALADILNFNQVIKMRQDVLMALYEYRIACQKSAETLSEFEDLRKSEMIHRYFKVAKLAAVYAFIDRSVHIKIEHLHYAIAMAEASGIAFSNLLNRDRPYVKLANYICSINKELTQADLTEDLPFYRGTEQARRDMLNLAIAHGYKNGMYICTEVTDGIQFLSGKKAPEVNMDKLIISYGKQIAEGYLNEQVRWNRLHELVTIDNYHWINHHLRDGYRDEQHCIPGFNIIVLDVENSIKMETAKLLLKNYTWLMHTTKRHSDDEHRFRIIMPLSHHAEMDAREFRDFMKNIYDWLPFEVDTQTAQRSRKWMTCKGQHYYNYGENLDTLQFVPKTKKADEQRQLLSTQTNMSNLERWFINNTEVGNRNNKMRNYALMLVDAGYDFETVKTKVMGLNSRIQEPLDESEILSTIMVTVSRKMHEKHEEKELDNY